MKRAGLGSDPPGGQLSQPGSSNGPEPRSRRAPQCVIVHRSVHYNASLDRTFFALSDPTRRGILERLGRGPATIGELAKPFGLTINGVKKHVGILEEVDLVVTAKIGRARECQLGPARLEGATEWIDDYRRTWQRRLDRFGTHVEAKDAGR
jgi:DNA-binding transcriptional ArsR family regulator